ncbi:MAG: protein kinase family protein [Erysipelothrix sp.]|nr:protein kinase family protein [Erysipelothrix sp.]
MNKKADRIGGNGDIFFTDVGTAKKFLRNTSSIEKIQRFSKELNVVEELSKSKIPNIVEIVGVNIDNNNIKNSYIEMKRYDGSLSELLSLTKGDAKFTLELLLPIVTALKCLTMYTPKIIHRDLKPDNILFIKKVDKIDLFLTDFGTCFLLEDDTRLTGEQTAVGARLFMAPEYEVGRVENIDEKGDIFSLGKIIWYMINGEKNEFLPSNFWFINDYDLTKKFPMKTEMILANSLISSCLNINPSDRCDYDELIRKIEYIVFSSVQSVSDIKKSKVKQYQEMRKIHFEEVVQKNGQLVQVFNLIFVNTVDMLLNEYKDFPLLKKIKEEYTQKIKKTYIQNSLIGQNAAYFIFSTTYDNIYISILYNPASNKEKFANIEFTYKINSNSNTGKFLVKYDTHDNIVIDYLDRREIMNEKTLFEIIDQIIMNYVDG